jgi:phosphate ABC transporter phosphate-binding protein
MVGMRVVRWSQVVSRAAEPLARRLVVAVVALAAVCGGLVAMAQPSSAASFAPVTGAGSTWSYPAIHTWIDSLDEQGVAINYTPNGSASGQVFFAGGQADWAASELPYGVQDGNNTDPPPARGYTYVPDTAGAVTFAYNLTVNGQRMTGLRLSGATIAAIFTDKITMWNDPMIAADNPGVTLPATAIIPVVRSDSSGANWNFTQWMAATQGSSWNAYCQQVGFSPCAPRSTYPVLPGSNMISQPGDGGVTALVSQPTANGAIGITEYSFALAAGLPVANVLNEAGYYTAPTPGNVGVSLLAAQVDANPSDPLYQSENLSQVYTDPDPRTYELSYYSYMIMPTDLSDGMTTDKGYTLGTFGQYLLCQGQQQVDPLGYAALPINLVEDGFAQLARIPGADVPTTTAAILQGCDNPTFSSDGTDTLALTDPQPPTCDQQGTSPCITIGVTFGPTATTTLMSASPSPAAAGQSVTLAAGVAPVSGTATPTGTVQFWIGGTAIGAPVPVDASGVATTTTTFTAAGTDALSAVYTPSDPTAFAASTGTLTLSVGPPPTSGVIPLAATDPPTGSFTLTVDTSDIVTLTVSGSGATAATTPITVSDTRNTYPGWAVSGQASDFTGSGTASGGSIAGDQLGWTPTATALGSGVTLGPAVTPASPGLDTTPAILASADAGSGYGISTLGADLTLAIPAAAAAGPYSGSLTVTAITAFP